MAITSTGYDGSITETQWSKLVPLAGGSHYGVSGANDWKVTTHASLDRGVNIATGSGWGHGVLDTSDAVASLQGGTISSGTRWDMVVARRNWAGTGGATTFVLIAGSSSKALPSRNTNPGTLDDQPIALVQFTAGNTAATAIVDLRCWSRNGGMVARDTLALNYLFHLGAQIKISGALWSCVPDGAGNPVWSTSATDGAVTVFGAGSGLAGALNPSSNFLVQAGTQTATTDGAGFSRVTFPKPFPNGLLTVILTNGDSAIDRAIGTVMVMSVAGAPWNNGTAADAVYAVTTANGTARPNQLHRVNYIAIGW